MQTRKLPVYLLMFMICFGCSDDSDPTPNPDPVPVDLYFPPIGSDDWETASLQSLGWNSSEEAPLYSFLEENGTEAFIILKDGRIVAERYFNGFSATQNHTWNSAAKTLTAFLTGIAQEQGFLDIDDPSSDYMGEGWSSLTPDQEQQISVRNHLTMTTGLDFSGENSFCTDRDCLVYKDDPDTFWYYHNAAYTLLDNIISGAVDQDFKDYFNEMIRDRIGMQGTWVKTGYLNLYFSTARSMARFGLLNLNEGIWDGTPILGDPDYFTAMTTTSQELNRSYGYLWWLNGKDSYHIPGSELEYEGKLVPEAPDDLVAGLGAMDQKLYVVPSRGLVIVRLGDSADETELGPTAFDNELWIRLNALME
ncbi:MAG: serine hydrolase domain-containing protein [Sediminicola sp.]